jgi:hypothetical protein
MVGFAVIMAIAFAMLAALCWRAVAGMRDGDRPGDATVKALLRGCGQPDEPRPVVIATVRNPSDKPVLAGLSARRTAMPGWLRCGPDVTVPIRTTRRALLPTAYATVGVVPARSSARFPVPVSGRARRYLLTAAIGQAGGRLRVHRLHVAGPHSAAPTELPLPFGEDLFD